MSSSSLTKDNDLVRRIFRVVEGSLAQIRSLARLLLVCMYIVSSGS